MTLYEKSGNHPLIVQYNQLVAELKRLEEEIRNTEKAEKAPTPKYGNRTVEVWIQKKSLWGSRVPDGTECIRITEYLLNRDEYNAWMARWGGISGDWKDTHQSVTYYVTEDGILTSDHGGWLILKTPTLISTNEWLALKRGEIPQQLLD